MPLAHAWLPSSYAALSRPCFAPLSRYGAQMCAASLRLPSRRRCGEELLSLPAATLRRRDER